jgi:hypothetical protein
MKLGRKDFIPFLDWLIPVVITAMHHAVRDSLLIDAVVL